MLKRASTAQTEVRATRRHAIGGALQHFEQHRIVVLLVTLGATETDALARQRAGNERRLAVAHDAFTLMGKAGDYADFFWLNDLLHQKLLRPALPTLADIR